MKQEYTAENYTDEKENPSGGSAAATGVSIVWQNGPLGRGEDRIEPNGAFVETVIAIALQRIEFYQDSKFACRENLLAIEHLKIAAMHLDSRTRDREAAGVEGTHSSRETEWDGAIEEPVTTGGSDWFGPTADLATYIGTKIVRAGDQMKNGEMGYKVIYPDDYVSWSPKEVFEDAYRLLGDGEAAMVKA